jgi:hypothetical protein
MTVPSLNAYIQGLDVVSADQLNTYIQTAQNTTQLRALIGLPGMEVDLQGITTPNDGGGGRFYWNSTALGPDDNDTVIVPQYGIPGAWVRLNTVDSSVTILPNIAALRNLLGGPVAKGVWVQGYYTPGDGGGGAYNFISTDLTSADNGGTIIIDAQNHRYYSNAVGTGMVTDKLFGAHVDGFTDDTTFVQNAVTYLENTHGGRLTLVAGTRVINGGVFINVGGITIEGTGWADSTGDLAGPNTPPAKGTIVLTTLANQPVFTVLDPAMGTIIRNIGFLQNQPADVANWTPNSYPPTIFLQGAAGGSTGGSDTLIENVFFWNCFVGIQLGSVANNTESGHVTLRRIWGMPLAIGVVIYQANSVTIEDVQFSVFNRQSTLGIQQWILAHGVGIVSQIATAPKIRDVNIVGYLYGIQFTAQAAGTTSGFFLSNIRIINCQWGLVFTGTGPANKNIGGLCNNFWYEWNVAYNGIQSNAIVFENGATAEVFFTNVNIGGATDAGISLIGGNCGIAISNLFIGGWNLSGLNQPAILANAGSIVTLSGIFLTVFGGSAPATGGGGTFNISHVN